MGLDVALLTTRAWVVVATTDEKADRGSLDCRRCPFMILPPDDGASDNAEGALGVDGDMVRADRRSCSSLQ